MSRYRRRRDIWPSNLWCCQRWNHAQKSNHVVIPLHLCALLSMYFMASWWKICWYIRPEALTGLITIRSKCVAQYTLTTALTIISKGQTSKNSDAARYANKDRLMIMSLIEQYKRTCAGFWPYVINTEEDDDEDVLDGSQWHQTINIRPWQENVIGTNDAYFHTVAWCRAWGTYPRSRWEVAARTTRWEIAVPLPKRPKRATARNYNYVLVSNARPRECAILSQPDARAGRTRGLL